MQNDCYDDVSPSTVKEKMSEIICKDKDCIIKKDKRKDIAFTKDSTAVLDQRMDVREIAIAKEYKKSFANGSLRRSTIKT